MAVHSEPFQCSSHPCSAALPPTAQTSFGPLPHTPWRYCAMPEGTKVQEVPSQCKVVPPTAQTSSGPLPHRASSGSVVPLGSAPQKWPFQWSITPLSPAAQASSAEVPHTALMLPPVGRGLSQH